MKTLTMLLALMLVTSCATNHVKQAIVAEQEVIEDTIKEDKIIGDSLPSWIHKSGIENGMVYVVGKAEFGANKSPFYVEKAALMDAEIALFSDAPSDIRILTQNALTGAGIDSAEFYQIQTKLQEVVGVTGVRHDSEKVTCRKIIRYGELSSRLTRACWVQASIPVRELAKAYRRTLALKFGKYKANEFKDRMDDELKRINKNPLMEKRNETSNTLPSRVNNNNSDDGRKRLRLPSSKVKESQKQSKVSNANSERGNLSKSRVKVKDSNASGRISSANKSRRSTKANKQELSEANKALQKLKSKRRSLAQVQL